ncbi:ferritin-like domain-containing protein [Bradyrhizobium diazoefficiens]
MNRFQRVIEILDRAVGGPNAPVGFHGAVWRNISRNDFVARKIFGLQLVAVGDGAGSNLVKALKGEAPFGADLAEPPPDATFSRMPSGLSPVPPSEIAFIETWINEGCLEDDVPSAVVPTWRRTNAPIASRRTDDIWFIDPRVGWAVNSDGNIIKTEDGGENWVPQHSTPGVYLRSVAFANANVGWVGTLTRSRRLLRTTNGGTTWSVVTPLPPNAPVAVCGLSVVSELVVYASGTNRPSDVPAMMKTVDGGATWTAWDMSAHASILIDTYFTDALHGWVVGGKTDEAAPTTRDKVKPVILETTDGGATWTNRLAGQEAEFPFGEWGWKIFFVNSQLGFVSLENFDAAAVARTTDGGRTWIRMAVEDGQGNANLEGVGFADDRRGWVGGWGSRDLSKGYSSATVDGGATWAAANQIGLFINRFRFFGNPVTVGYASGDTVYKYSSDPIPVASAALTAAQDATIPLLPNGRTIASGASIPINMRVPVGTKRLTLDVWDRFGVEVGRLLDEIRPRDGQRVFDWDGTDVRGATVPMGDYIIRMTADDVTASSIVTRASAPPSVARTGGRRDATLRLSSAPRRASRSTVAALMTEATPPERDLQWLKEALQIAIQLELATLPPYLTAYWTIKQEDHEAKASISEIWREEMAHFGLVCNLLVAIGGTPLLTDAAVVPTYPGPLPGGVRPGLIVPLRKLDKAQAKIFMEIEYPQDGPLPSAVAGAGTTFDSIGEFYGAILATFQKENPTLKLDRQLRSSGVGVYKIGTMAKVEETIRLINLQGEGSNVTPEEGPGDLAHYYRFGQIYNEKRYVRNPATGKWGYDPAATLPLPETWEMADIPAGGYLQAEVPDMATWDLIQTFDQRYSNMLRLLETAWLNGNQPSLFEAISEMGQMASVASQLVAKPRAEGAGTYGPCFRYLS